MVLHMYQAPFRKHSLTITQLIHTRTLWGREHGLLHLDRKKPGTKKRGRADLLRGDKGAATKGVWSQNLGFQGLYYYAHDKTFAFVPLS